MCYLILPHEVREKMYVLRVRKAVFLAEFDELQHPGHVLAKIVHRVETLYVFFYIFLLRTKNVVPIGGAHDWHLVDGEVFVDDIHRADLAVSSRGEDRCCRLKREILAG